MNPVSNVITIDGPVGSGKGTVGQSLALKLGWDYLDSGALYRVCALVAKEHELSDAEPRKIVQVVKGGDFRSFPRTDGDDADVVVHGEDVSERIRTPEISQLASKLAAHGEIRTGLMTLQRNYPCTPGLVADGRDMGTVVFPNAVLKVFLDASASARAHRKYRQLKNKGFCVNFNSLCDEIRQRDARDSERAHAPLTKPEGALVIDSSSLRPGEVVEQIFSELNLVMQTDNYG